MSFLLLLLGVISMSMCTPTCVDDMSDLLRRIESLESRRPTFSVLPEPLLLGKVTGNAVSTDLANVIASDSGVYALSVVVQLKHEQKGVLPHVNGRIHVRQGDDGVLVDSLEMAYAGNTAQLPFGPLTVPWDVKKSSVLHLSNSIDAPFLGSSCFEVYLVGVHAFK
jgi:hypothetical protein